MGQVQSLAQEIWHAAGVAPQKTEKKYNEIIQVTRLSTVLSTGYMLEKHYIIPNSDIQRLAHVLSKQPSSVLIILLLSTVHREL